MSAPHAIRPSRRRRGGRDLAVAGLALSAAMFGLNLVSALGADALPAGTAPSVGMTISPTSGDSSTPIALTFASPNNVCPGDTATGNFRVNTFMVPASVDAATLTYNASGPIRPTGVTNWYPLYAATGQAAQVNKNTAVTTGQLIGLVETSFGVFGPTDIAAGQWKIGYACSKAPALGQPQATERYWQQVITIAPSATGGPAQFTWSTGTAAATTTTTPPAGGTSTTVAPTSTVAGETTSTTTTTTVAGDTTSTTTTAPGGGETTTTGAATSTTAAATTTVAAATTTAATTTTVRATTTTVRATTTTAATTTTVRAITTTATPTTTTIAVASGAVVTTVPFSSGTGFSSLPVTGSSFWRGVLLWGLLCCIFGRMVWLSARPIERRGPRTPR